VRRPRSRARGLSRRGGGGGRRRDLRGVRVILMTGSVGVSLGSESVRARRCGVSDGERA
jgi:hypothetical protein